MVTSLEWERFNGIVTLRLHFEEFSIREFNGAGTGMSAESFDYDLLVIGSGPAGQRAAIQGAKLDKKVAVVERKAVLGGCSVNLGTIPSKTLREVVLELSGYRSREFYGASYPSRSTSRCKISWSAPTG